MPYKEGVFVEPDNEDRAGWAHVALNAFAKETRNDPREQEVEISDDEIGGRDQLEEVAGDLICDLMHLLKLHGLEPEEIIATARYNFEFEEDEEAGDPVG
jgi:O-succinylbenzoate synthase